MYIVEIKISYYSAKFEFEGVTLAADFLRTVVEHMSKDHEDKTKVSLYYVEPKEDAETVDTEEVSE